MENEKKIRRIALLTSGGDAPGMNAAIRAVVRTAIYNNIQVLGFRRGYNGLINNDFMEMDSRTVNKITSHGGTMLYTARCDEFKTEAGQKRAADNCRYLGLDGLICIGGDGTFRGAQALSQYGIPTVGIPATIDNDIGCSH
ncbi:MAG: 6-phosphofructokinase, partial [Bacteroidales bacterium]|nr:6-phosphofructokinase [Bacteroidales bacterium]